MTTSPQLPPLPDHVAHVHSNGEFCADMHIASHEWPVNLFTADQMLAFWKAGAAWQREQDAKLCEGVARHTTAIDGTAFYVATGQCAAAIRGQQEPTI